MRDILITLMLVLIGAALAGWAGAAVTLLCCAVYCVGYFRGAHAFGKLMQAEGRL
jgi:hypothetical protein